MFGEWFAPLRGTPDLPASGGTSVAAADAGNFTFAPRVREIRFRNDTGGDAYVLTGGTASNEASPTAGKSIPVPSGESLTLRGLWDDVSVYFAAAAVLDGAGRNATLIGYR